MALETLKNVILILTTRCDHASVLLSKSQETSLSKTERWALSLHLLICRMCRKYKKQLKLMRNILGRLTEPQTYDAVMPFLLDKKQSEALRGRISKKIMENLDSM